jgi:hypothetical protein
MRLAALILAAGLLDLALIQPNHPGAATWGALRLFPLELPVILLALVALPGPARGVRALLTLWLVAIALHKAADMAMFTALGRDFNLAVDGGLVRSGWDVLRASAGPWLAAGAVAVALALLAGLAAALWWATGVWARLSPDPGARRLAAAGVAVAAALALAEAGQAMGAWRLPAAPPVAAFTARLTVEKLRALARARRAQVAFAAAAATDPMDTLAAPLSRLAGRDVILVFVESYGRASFDNLAHAALHDPVRARAETALAAAGLAVRSGWLTAPIEGGQSWLAHATLAAGLAVPDPAHYGALLASPRRTLWQIAAAAGWRTAAVVPAITRAWPEAARLGHAVVLDAGAMGYAGPPFAWVTMPDQFTLARFRDRLPPDPRPLFATLVLISSHAPWTPVPDPLPWEAVGDGTAFAPMAAAGPAVETVWASPEGIRAAYGRSLAYVLEIAFDWAARQGGGAAAPLVVILGDHQPAGFVAQGGGRDVPVHLIGPPGVLEAVADWGFGAGLRPGPAPAWPMEAFRDRFLKAFSGPSP